MLIVFCDMVSDMLSNKKLEAIVTDLFIRSRKHFTCFHHTITLCNSKKTRLNSKEYFTMKI